MGCESQVPSRKFRDCAQILYVPNFDFQAARAHACCAIVKQASKPWITVFGVALNNDESLSRNLGVCRGTFQFRFARAGASVLVVVVAEGVR